MLSKKQATDFVYNMIRESLGDVASLKPSTTLVSLKVTRQLEMDWRNLINGAKLNSRIIQPAEAYAWETVGNIIASVMSSGPAGEG